MDLPAFPELNRIAQEELLLGNRRLRRNVVETEGSDAKAISGMSAIVADETIGHLAQVIADQSYDTAKGKKLDRLFYERTGELRKPAAPAVVDLAFSLDTVAVSGFTIPLFYRVQTADGKSYNTIESKPFPAGSVGPVMVKAQSASTGNGQSVLANTLTVALEPIVGASGPIRVTNPLASAGGGPEETDDELAARGKLYFTTAKVNTLPALERGALSVPGVRHAYAFEFFDERGELYPVVTVVVADAFTEQFVNAGSTPASYQVQSNALAGLVKSTLELEYAGAGRSVSVYVAKVKLIGVTLALRVNAATAVETTLRQARAVIVNYVNSLKPGSPFLREKAQELLRTVPGLVITGSEIVSPEVDVIPRNLEALRTSMSLTILGSATDNLVQGTLP